MGSIPNWCSSVVSLPRRPLLPPPDEELEAFEVEIQQVLRELEGLE